MPKCSKFNTNNSSRFPNNNNSKQPKVAKASSQMSSRQLIKHQLRPPQGDLTQEREDDDDF